MGKGKGRKQGAGSGGGGLFDRNLVPRIENYALNHELDIDDVVDHLRVSYKEYQRQKVQVLRQMVSRAAAVLQRKGVDKPEIQLQVHALCAWCLAPARRQL